MQTQTSKPLPNRRSNLLTACRDLALQLLIQSFDGFFDHLEDEFLDLAEKAIDRNLRDTYFAARVETRSSVT